MQTRIRRLPTVGRRGAALALILFLLIPAMRAAADFPPASQYEVAAVNRFLQPLVYSGAVDPIQVAIIESDIIACIGDYDSFTGSNDPDRVQRCEQEAVPNSIYFLLVAAKRYISGTWFTNYGAMTIDKNFTGTLTYTNGGTSTIQFSKADTGDPKVVGFVFAYSNTFNDRGYGAVVMSDDGCLMYGKYISTVNATNTGAFLMARC